MKTILPGLAWAIFYLLPLLSGNASVASAPKMHSEGADLVFGTLGTGPGEFTVLLGMAFDPPGNLYTLEGGGVLKIGKTTTYTGVGRVQKFDAEGNYISEFPLGEDIAADRKAWPWNIAVGADDNVYVAFPGQGFVRQYGPDGKKIRDHALPNATALAFDPVTSRVAAIARYPIVPVRPPPAPKGQPPAAPVPPPPEQMQVFLLDPAGGAPAAVTLSEPIHYVNSMAIDKKGNFYFQGGDKRSQIFVFDEKGQHITTIGSGMGSRNEDGSEPRDTVAVDSQGNIYNTGQGNPNAMTEYTADGKWVLQHRSWFHYGDPWNGNTGYPNTTFGVLLAVAPDDRIWVASMAIHDPTSINYPKYTHTPSIIRTNAKFFDPKVFGTTRQTTLSLGLLCSLESTLPSNVAQSLDPIKDTFAVAPANRHVKQLDVDYHVYDYFKTEVSKGSLTVPLKDGMPASADFSFTPPRYGWYIVEANVSSGGEKLAAISQQIGVTPVYANLPVRPVDFLKGWNDIPRQMFSGLVFVRLSGDAPPDDLDKSVALAQQDGAVFSIQLTDKKDNFTPEKLRPLIERYKGRVKYYELYNEPNFTFSPQDFAEKAKPVFQMIKQVDPDAQVMGPSTCGIMLGWIEKFYQAGGTDACDIVAVHDYEGHESIVPEHWRYKIAALRALMDKYGQGKKDIWQTERAIAGVRAGNLLGGAQAVRTALQRNLMVTLGVPSDHNLHYYLNQGGYASVPSYVWDSTGPHPAALTLRTRETLTRDRTYAGMIDFGPTGNKMLLGLRYEGGDGPMVIVQNLGTTDLPIDVGVKGGDAVEVIDSFGNVKSVAVKDGKMTLPIPQLPLYFHLKSGQELAFPSIDYGRNIAPAAQITYSGQATGDMSLLQNGILETYQSGDPDGDTNGTKIWKGELLAPDEAQYLELSWKSPRTIDGAILFSPHADNGFCALLDYDLQAWEGGAWKTISQVRTPIPGSDFVSGCSDVLGITYMEDNNFSAVKFPQVTTDKLRIVPLRTTFGLNPDAVANQVMNAKWGGTNNARPMFREIEIYAPKGQILMSSHADQPNKTAAFDSDKVTVTVSNSGAQSFQGTILATAPEGWSVTPDKAPVTVAAGAKADLVFTVKPPTDIVVGNAMFNFEARDDKGAPVDFDVFSFTITSPLQFHQDPLPPAKNGVQNFIFGISNQTSDPISGTIRVELSGPGKIDPVEQPFGPLDSPKWYNPNIPVNVDLKKGAWTATYSVTANHLISKLEVNLAQRQWSVIGPFENDIEKVFGPESTIADDKVDLTQNYTDTFGGEQKWQVISDDAAGKVNLVDHFNASENAVAYAAAWVNSPKAQSAYLSGALNCIGKIWVNGKLVSSRDKGRGVVWGQDHALVDLVAGENLILLKISADGQKQWAFLFDLLDPATHKPLPDLVYSPQPSK